MSSVMPQKYTHLWLSSCLCFFWLQHSDCSPLQNKHLLWSFNKKNDQRIKAHLFLFFMFLFPSKSLCSSAACGLAISLNCGLWLRVCCFSARGLISESGFKPGAIRSARLSFFDSYFPIIVSSLISNLFRFHSFPLLTLTYITIAFVFSFRFEA